MQIRKMARDEYSGRIEALLPKLLGVGQVRTYVLLRTSTRGQFLSFIGGCSSATRDTPHCMSGNFAAHFVNSNSEFWKCRCSNPPPESASPEARSHCPIPFKPRSAGCEIGPLIVGAGEGDPCGAGIGFARGACGVAGAKRVVACAWARLPWPALRATIGVDPATQATASAATKRPRMTASLLHFWPLTPSPPISAHPCGDLDRAVP
jgi:hypothetical protein